MSGRLAGKVAIITGASSALGRVMAKRFAAEGASLLLCARNEGLVLGAARDAGNGAIGMRADVTDEAAVAAMVDRALAAFGQVELLMTNAAAPGKDLYVWEQTLENWNATIAIDLTAAMLCTREVLNRSMLARGSGTIVNFSSTAGWTGLPRKTHYCSAKSALRAFTKTVALEVGPRGIRCNCLVPGGIDTDLYRNYVRRIAGEQGISYEEQRAKDEERVPLRTISTPDDVANLALFLASDESRTITGQSINCDAGAVMIG